MVVSNVDDILAVVIRRPLVVASRDYPRIAMYSWSRPVANDVLGLQLLYETMRSPASDARDRQVEQSGADNTGERELAVAIHDRKCWRSTRLNTSKSWKKATRQTVCDDCHRWVCASTGRIRNAQFRAQDYHTQSLPTPVRSSQRTSRVGC